MLLISCYFWFYSRNSFMMHSFLHLLFLPLFSPFPFLLSPKFPLHLPHFFSSPSPSHTVFSHSFLISSFCAYVLCREKAPSLLLQLSYPFLLSTATAPDKDSFSMQQPLTSTHASLTQFYVFPSLYSFSAYFHWFSTTRSMKPINIFSWRLKWIDNAPPRAVKNEHPLVCY